MGRTIARTIMMLMGRTQGEGGSGGPELSLKNHNNTGFLCTSGPDPLQNYKTTKPELNVEPSSAHQRNADDSTFIVVF